MSCVFKPQFPLWTRKNSIPEGGTESEKAQTEATDCRQGLIQRSLDPSTQGRAAADSPGKGSGRGAPRPACQGGGVRFHRGGMGRQPRLLGQRGASSRYLQKDPWEKGVSELSEARGRGPVARRVGVTEAFKQGNSSSSDAHSCVLGKLGSRPESCLGLERPLVGRCPRDAVYLNQ